MNKTHSAQNAASPSHHLIETAELSKSKVTQFKYTASAQEMTHIADNLGVSDIAKLRFDGKITPKGKRDFRLTGTLGVTVTQACGVTLEPVRTRIDDTVERIFVAQWHEEMTDEEREIPDDDRLEPLGDLINLLNIAAEHIALVIPAFPRKEGLDDFEITAAPDGARPLDDAAMKPFASLAALKSKLEENDG